jgi:hypothetical protein
MKTSKPANPSRNSGRRLRPDIELPKRSMMGEYDDQASLKNRTFVPEKY